METPIKPDTNDLNNPVGLPYRLIAKMRTISERAEHAIVILATMKWKWYVHVSFSQPSIGTNFELNTGNSSSAQRKKGK
jgi:hypothetical protein